MCTTLLVGTQCPSLSVVNNSPSGPKLKPLAFRNPLTIAFIAPVVGFTWITEPRCASSSFSGVVRHAGPG